jgi:hypothetical protein
VRAFRAEFPFERLDERLEQIECQCIRLAADRLAHHFVHDRADDDRAPAFALRGVVYLPDRLGDPLRRVDERNRHALERDLIELREQAVAEHLGGDARAVRQEEDRTPIRHGDQSDDQA